jgi:TPR repeat protein
MPRNMLFLLRTAGAKHLAFRIVLTGLVWLAGPSLAQTNTVGTTPAAGTWLAASNRLAATRIAEVRKAAEQGDMAAQFFLGCAGLDGFARSEGRGEAIQWIQKAAEQGLAEAQAKLGWMYECGVGVEKSRPQAEMWMGRAAEQGLAEAQYQRGMMAMSQRDQLRGQSIPSNIGVAADWFRKAAAQGHSEAMIEMGRLYYYGKLGHKYVEAAKWFKLAADLGSEEAMMLLANTYSSGRPDMPRDQVQSARWLRLAAEQKNNVGAQYELSQLLLEAQDFDPDPLEAELWLRRAATNGHAIAQFKFALRKARQPDGSTDVNQLPVPLLLAADSMVCPEAVLWLGVSWELGRQGGTNLQKAANCYNYVLEFGDSAAQKVEAFNRLFDLYTSDRLQPSKPDALAKLLSGADSLPLSPEMQYRIGEICYAGQGLAPDPAKAVNWFTLAAKNGSAEARYRIGQLWADGTDGTPDLVEAVRWYSKAATLGLVGAQLSLGRACQTGEGIEKNVAEAWAWLRLASDHDAVAAQEMARLEAALTPQQKADAQLRYRELSKRLPAKSNHQTRAE